MAVFVNVSRRACVRVEACLSGVSESASQAGIVIEREVVNHEHCWSASVVKRERAYRYICSIGDVTYEYRRQAGCRRRLRHRRQGIGSGSIMSTHGHSSERQSRSLVRAQKRNELESDRSLPCRSAIRPVLLSCSSESSLRALEIASPCSCPPCRPINEGGGYC